MNDAISNYGRMTQSNAALRSSIDKVEKRGPSAAQAKEELAPSLEKTASAGADKVSLSNVAQKVMAQPDFDRSKVEAIKQAIKEGNYPVNPRRIAENFVALEKMISN
ncbi:flagellar biosynthesis anti-sigma factor FlgM [Limnohabitans sp.]|jgi:negative regulator of flagellin synthesis FlgM|uniref:flagellar biosynthesis anti-sigma factor FlgM n=1 Tax=Limnohabitans sp. TaxID=1907725 RepID=UPI00286F51A0|nr:flagellar biosynthesis anti-sigma factor FlgM [Limnohabitans sp.]